MRPGVPATRTEPTLAEVGQGTQHEPGLMRAFTVGRGWVQFPVGRGIVEDSVRERECEETRHMAEGPLRALG